MLRTIKRLSIVVVFMAGAGYASNFVSRAACERAVARAVAGPYAEAGFLVYTPANELGAWGYPGTFEILRRVGFRTRRCPAGADEIVDCIPGVGVAWGQPHWPYLVKVQWMHSSGVLATTTGHSWFLCLFGYVIRVAEVGEGTS
jgi:hypothetical protein